MKILNLYSGLGGNRSKWGDSHEITAVETDIKILAAYSQSFPKDIAINCDSFDFLKKNMNDFDLIWSSPPCQSHSRMVKFSRHSTNKEPDMRLYHQIEWLKMNCNKIWIVENVIPYYKPLIKPDFKIGRHIFWSNFDFTFSRFFDPPKFSNMINTSTVKGSEDLKKWLGLNYQGTIYYGKNHDPCQVLRNCVHPDIGKQILDFIIDQKQ